MPNAVTSIQHSFSYVLKPLGLAYGAIMRMREGFYRSGIFSSWEAPAMTVSVGNIGWGGSGKTPIAGWLLDWAKSNNHPSLLLTRGYKAKPVQYPYHVKPGALVEEAGDEPLMLATEHPSANVVVDPKRTRAGEWGVQRFNPRLVVLDDGFQHMAVKRHLNLVLLRPEDLDSQWNRVIPAGSWREPASALKRADAFMIKVGPKGFDKLKPYFEGRLGRFHKPVFSFQVVPTGVRRVLDGARAGDFDGEKYLLVTGVGDPELVKRTATNFIGYKPMHHMVFRDHHAYTKTDVLEMQTAANRLGCKVILCTPKDAVKLGPMCTKEFWQFELRVTFGPSTIGEDTPFPNWWQHRFDNFNPHDPNRFSGSGQTADAPEPDETPDNG